VDWTCCRKECTEKLWKEIVPPDWSDLRLKAFRRDNFQCVKCGKIPERQIWKLRYWQTSVEDFKKKMQKTITFLRFETRPYNCKDELVAIHKDSSKLIGDHIEPIALGGDQWDINNIQTLCEPCNKIKTAQDIKEIAKLRVIEKNEAKGRKQLTEVPDCITAQP
jgi:5-methylcytosine-specific restriction endonuclease McrA